MRLVFTVDHLDHSGSAAVVNTQVDTDVASALDTICVWTGGPKRRICRTQRFTKASFVGDKVAALSFAPILECFEQDRPNNSVL